MDYTNFEANYKKCFISFARHSIGNILVKIYVSLRVGNFYFVLFNAARIFLQIFVYGLQQFS